MSAGAAVKAAIARRLALACVGVLQLAMLVQIAGIDRLPVSTRVSLWVIAAVPLLLLLPGMLRGQWKTFQWLCFVTLFYFLVVVDRLFSPLATWLHWLDLALVCTLFVTAMMYARWQRLALASADT